MRFILVCWLAVAHSWSGVKPDPAKTPGFVRPDITRAAVCATKWGHDERHVDDAKKAIVALAYEVQPSDYAAYEFDHLIPRELGGADDVLNLWPQPRFGTWNAHRKDVLENQLHRFVCDGSMTLEAAQHWMATDWITAYQRFTANGGRRHHHRRTSSRRVARGRGRSR